MLYISADEVKALLSYKDCIRACEEGLLAKWRGEAEDVPRTQLNTGTTTMLFMLSMDRSKGLVGMRIYNVIGAPIRLMYILWDASDGRPLAIMEARWIRDVRTGAIGAIGAKYLARSDSKVIGVLGSGGQARSGLAAHSEVYNFSHCRVFSPNQEHRASFAKEMSLETNLNIEPVDSPEKAVSNADIVLVATSAGAIPTVPTEPVLRGALLEQGIHVSSIGGRAELDDEVVVKASKIVTDSKAQFQYESRDITAQVEKGLLTWDQVAELQEVVAGARPGRENQDEITLIKTVGTAIQDLPAAATVYARALEKGVGLELGDAFPPSLGWYWKPGSRVPGPPNPQNPEPNKH